MTFSELLCNFVLDNSIISLYNKKYGVDFFKKTFYIFVRSL